jgi:hypothetical protein
MKLLVTIHPAVPEIFAKNIIFLYQIIADYCKTYFQKCEMNFLYEKMFEALTLMFHDQMS